MERLGSVEDKRHLRSYFLSNIPPPVEEMFRKQHHLTVFIDMMEIVEVLKPKKSKQR